MAFSDKSENDVYDLRDALENVQDRDGASEFLEGAQAVCEWLTAHNNRSVEDFLHENDMM